MHQPLASLNLPTRITDNKDFKGKGWLYVKDVIDETITSSEEWKECRKTPTICSAFDLLKKEIEQEKISTTIEELDRALQGGLGCSQICELCGDTGSGKTQLCFNICVTHLLRHDDKEVFFISTNDGFSVRRIKDIVRNSREYRIQSDDAREILVNKLLGRIHVIEVDKIEELVATVKYLQGLRLLNKVSLLIIDSIFIPFKEVEFEDRCRILYRLLADLQKLAEAHEFSVVSIQIQRFYSNSPAYAKTDFKNGIRKITMCHAKTRNSLSIGMMETLIKEINQEQDNPELRVIIIAGEGPIFSAGHNLKELTQEPGQSQHRKVFNIATALMNTIIDCPVPVIARVDGLAAAAGCQLVAQCDLALCSHDSTFSTPGANFGIFCSTPGVALARCVPKMTAMKMLLTGQPITSEEAKQAGLVAEVCPKEELDAAIEVICKDIKSKSRSVIAIGKKFYYKQINHDLKKAYSIGGEVMVENINTKDGSEGVKSFVEKRKPNWSHK